jgi:hypothetical protein
VVHLVYGRWVYRLPRYPEPPGLSTGQSA